MSASTGAGQGVKEVVAALEKAIEAPPDKLKTEAAYALRAAVRLRDGLIARLRAAEAPEDRTALRAALDQVNTATTLVASVAYPLEKIQREKLQSAKGVLEGLIAAGWV